MADLVVTSFSPRGAELYGRRMVEAFRHYWPPATTLVVYLDEPAALPGVTVRLTTDLTDWQTCRQKWAHDKLVHGRDAKANPKHRPYHYRYDAGRFAVKVFVMRDAAERLGRGLLTWLDGDTLTRQAVPAGWTASLLGDADVAYLGRGTMHPETGYLGFRIPEALPFLQWCADCFRTGTFRALRGYTDCHVVQAALAAVPVRAVDLTGAHYAVAKKSHVWPASPLAAYVTHFKGSTQKKVGAACSVL